MILSHQVCSHLLQQLQKTNPVSIKYRLEMDGQYLQRQMQITQMIKSSINAVR